MRRVRAYIGLGANLGDAGATLAGGVRALATLPGSAPPRGLAALCDGAGRRRRPAALPQRGRRARRARRSRSGHGRDGPADRTQAARAGVRPPGPRALGPARARSRPARLRPRPPGPGPTARGNVARSGQGRPAPRRASPRGARTGCSSSPRWPTSPPASSRRAGRKRSRPPPRAGSSKRAPTPPARSLPGTPPELTGRNSARCRRPPGADRRYSRTDGGRSRSNMWTVSTNRTCLVR